MKLIESVEGAEELVSVIKQAVKNWDHTLVLGVDCEGLNKDRPLSLIQVCVLDEVYVVDLFQVDPFSYGLKEIMENPYIVKIFHDFCEDAAALVNQYDVYCSRVFDTQIAHRMLTEATSGDGGKNDYSQNNIGLNELLKRYLNQANECKALIQSEMKNDRYFWEKRPLTPEMLKYASQDVVFLPYLYNSFGYVFDNYGRNSSTKKKIDFELSDVFSEAMKCNEYAQINRSVQKLKNGDVIQAFVKNIQKFGIYCSLNLGITGFINHKKSRKYVLTNHKIGDIVDVCVDSIQKKNNKVLLRLLDCADNTDFNSNDADGQYNDMYYDDSGLNDNSYYGHEPGSKEFGEDYPDHLYYDPYYDISASESPMNLTQSESYDRLIPTPEMAMYYSDAKQYNSVQYYTPGDLGYQPYQSELQNTTSTTYSYQNIRKYNKVMECSLRHLVNKLFTKCILAFETMDTLN